MLLRFSAYKVLFLTGLSDPWRFAYLLRKFQIKKTAFRCCSWRGSKRKALLLDLRLSKAILSAEERENKIGSPPILSGAFFQTSDIRFG